MSPLSLVDHFDRLPDPLLLIVFNNIGDIKALGRCCVVSKRFQTLVPQVDHVLVRVDCVIPEDAITGRSVAANPLASLFRILFSCVAKPIHAVGHFLSPPTALVDADQGGGVTHHSPTQVLKNFKEIRSLQIELPSGELGIEDGILLKWRADFGSTLENCVILGASSIIHNAAAIKPPSIINNSDDNNGSIPESFYTNGGLKLRVVWTISSLIAASARHYLLQPIIAEHKTLDTLVLADSDRQGVLCMNRSQLEELRVKPLSASSAAKRTLVPALNMRLWYAPHLELSNGTVLKGASLVAIMPSEAKTKEGLSDLSYVSSAFQEEPYRSAAKMLVKRRTYCLEMNSF